MNGTDLNPRASAISAALAVEYSSDGQPNGTTDDVAKVLDAKWDALVGRSDGHNVDGPVGLHHQITLVLAEHMFPGGIRAENAAKQVSAAVLALSTAEALNPRAAAMSAALATVYDRDGKSNTLTDAVAVDLDGKWEKFLQRTEGTTLDSNYGLYHHVSLVIWNWYAGGDLAEVAAKEVCTAVANLRTGTP